MIIVAKFINVKTKLYVCLCVLSTMLIFCVKMKNQGRKFPILSIKMMKAIIIGKFILILSMSSWKYYVFFVSFFDVKRSLFVLFTRLIKDCLRHNINASTCTLKGR